MAFGYDQRFQMYTHYIHYYNNKTKQTCFVKHSVSNIIITLKIKTNNCTIYYINHEFYYT